MYSSIGGGRPSDAGGPRFDPQCPLFHQIHAIDAYLKDVEKLPHGYVESNRVLEVPVILWDCKRLD